MQFIRESLLPRTGALTMALGLALSACGDDGGVESSSDEGDSAETESESGESESGESGSEDATSTGSEDDIGPETDTDTDTDTSAEGVCGDGQVDAGEVCDDGVNDGSYGGCNPDCASLAAHCGDGELNGDEACDDGNELANDGCTDYCVVPSSCQQLLEVDDTLHSDFYVISPEGYEGEPFTVYCDMVTDGGGWAVIFKNHGGAIGGELSNETLLEGDPGEYGDVIAPHNLELLSGVNPEAWAYYRAQPGHEWLKLGTLWTEEGELVHEQTLRVGLGAVTWDWILSLASEEPCHVAPNQISVVANGTEDLGQTDRVNSYQDARRTFGLANGFAEDSCDQGEDNLITDPNEVLFRLEDASTTNGIRHLFSYTHTSDGQDASRCQFACWAAETLDHYDAFTWHVR